MQYITKTTLERFQLWLMLFHFEYPQYDLLAHPHCCITLVTSKINDMCYSSSLILIFWNIEQRILKMQTPTSVLYHALVIIKCMNGNLLRMNGKGNTCHLQIVWLHHRTKVGFHDEWVRDVQHASAGWCLGKQHTISMTFDLCCYH